MPSRQLVGDILVHFFSSCQTVVWRTTHFMHRLAPQPGGLLETLLGPRQQLHVHIVAENRAPGCNSQSRKMATSVDGFPARRSPPTRWSTKPRLSTARRSGTNHQSEHCILGVREDKSKLQVDAGNGICAARWSSPCSQDTP